MFYLFKDYKPYAFFKTYKVLLYPYTKPYRSFAPKIKYKIGGLKIKSLKSDL